MGFRFRKSVKIAPGVRLNFGKKSTSVSLGGKGARFTLNNKGKATTSVGIPGTGLYYTESVGGTKKRKGKSKMAALKAKKVKVPKEDKPKKPLHKKWWVWAIVVWCILAIANGCRAEPESTTLPPAAVSSVSSQEIKKDIDPVESVITQEPETPPVVAPEAEDPQPEPKADPPAEVENVPDEVITEPEPTPEPAPAPKPAPEPAPAPKVEAPVVVAPIPEAPVVEAPPVADTPIAETPSNDYVAITYVLNNNTMKFHVELCPSVKTIKDHNRGSFTGSRDDLIAQGYSPCGKCHP